MECCKPSSKLIWPTPTPGFNCLTVRSGNPTDCAEIRRIVPYDVRLSEKRVFKYFRYVVFIIVLSLTRPLLWKIYLFFLSFTVYFSKHCRVWRARSVNNAVLASIPLEIPGWRFGSSDLCDVVVADSARNVADHFSIIQGAWLATSHSSTTWNQWRSKARGGVTLDHAFWNGFCCF